MYDITSFVERTFEDYKYYGNPYSDILICCPFCEQRGNGEDTKYHLSIHIDSGKQVVHCFRCDYATTWVHFVMDITGLPYWQAIGELYYSPHVRDDIKDFVNEKFTTVEKVITKHSLPEDFLLLSKVTKEDHIVLVSEAKAYLRRRGFISYHWKKYNLGVSYGIGWRVIIPIERDYWQGRALYKWLEPKYLNPKEPARDIMFNPDALNLYEEVVICEGAFSAMAVGDNATALISKEPTKERIERISNSPVETVIIALESGAFGSMKKLADAMNKCGKRCIIWKYDTGDPADGSPFIELNYDLKSKVFLMMST